MNQLNHIANTKQLRTSSMPDLNPAITGAYASLINSDLEQDFRVKVLQPDAHPSDKLI